MLSDCFTDGKEGLISRRNRSVSEVISLHRPRISGFHSFAATVPTPNLFQSFDWAYFHVRWFIFRKLLFMLRKGLHFVKAIGYFSSYTIMIEVIWCWSWVILGITMDDKDSDPTGTAAYLCQIDRAEMTIMGQNVAPKQKFDTKEPKVSELDGK